MRLVDVRGNQLRGKGRVAARERIDDGGVLAPYGLREARAPQHLAHRAAQVLPVRLHRLHDQRIAAGFIDQAVKVNVGLQRGRGIAGRSDRATARHQLPCPRQQFGCHPLRGKRGRQRLDRGAELVDRVEVAAIDCRHLQASAATFHQEALRTQLTEGGHHRLTRDVQTGRDLVLRDALAGRQRAVADRIEDALVDLLDQGLLRRDRLDRAGRHGVSTEDRCCSAV